jgi:hypothetical protein
MRDVLEDGPESRSIYDIYNTVNSTITLLFYYDVYISVYIYDTFFKTRFPQKFKKPFNWLVLEDSKGNVGHRLKKYK